MREPTVKRNAKGVFYCRYYMGTGMDGRQIRPYKSFPDAKSEAEALEMARKWVRSISWQSDMHTSDRLVDVLQRYIDMKETGNFAPSTATTYRSLLRCYVVPNLGNTTLGDIRPATMEGLYHVLMLSGRADGDPLSPNTVRKLHNFLRGAWRWMVSQGIAEANLMDAVTPPSPAEYEALAFDETELRRLSAALARSMSRPEHDHAAQMARIAATAAYIALWTGMRIGEVCALTRGDVRLGQRSIHVAATMSEGGALVRKPPKSKSGTRTISMDAKLADVLREHMNWTDAFLKHAAGRSTPLLCATPGVFLRPSAVSHEFSRLRDGLGLPRETHFHTLRHTHATYLLAHGTPVRVVSARLGHSKVSMTLEKYAHVLPGADAQAAAEFRQMAEEDGWA